MGAAAAPQTFTAPPGTRIERVSVTVDTREAFDRLVAEHDAHVIGGGFSAQTGEPLPPLAIYRDTDHGPYVFVELSEIPPDGAGAGRPSGNRRSEGTRCSPAPASIDPPEAA